MRSGEENQHPQIHGRQSQPVRTPQVLHYGEDMHANNNLITIIKTQTLIQKNLLDRRTATKGQFLVQVYETNRVLTIEPV